MRTILWLSGTCCALATAGAQSGVAVKESVFKEARFQEAAAYGANGKTIPDIVKDLGEKYNLKLMARLDASQVDQKSQFEAKAPLGQLLRDFAKSVGSTWKRNGDIFLLVPEAGKFASPYGENAGEKNDPGRKAKLEKFLGSLTDAQKDKMKSQGHLTWDDLSPDQQDFLRATNPKVDEPGSQMRWKFRGDGGELEIVKGEPGNA